MEWPSEKSREPGAPEFILFANEPDYVKRAMQAGIDSFIVDWEHRGKDARQQGYDTEVNHDTVEDLARLRTLGCPRRYCRVNAMGSETEGEVEAAIGAGATHVFLPLCGSRAEARRFAHMLAGRAQACVLIETQPGVEQAREIAREAIDMVYVGLNDLAISRGARSIFEAVADGTVERLASIFSDRAFGFGGLTRVDGGAPIPCRLLMGEMARLRTDFSFLRRAFRRDLVGRDMPTEVARMRELCAKLHFRTRNEVVEDREALLRAIAGSLAAPAPLAVTGIH